MSFAFVRISKVAPYKFIKNIAHSNINISVSVLNQPGGCHLFGLTLTTAATGSSLYNISLHSTFFDQTRSGRLHWGHHHHLTSHAPRWARPNSTELLDSSLSWSFALCFQILKSAAPARPSSSERPRALPGKPTPAGSLAAPENEPASARGAWESARESQNCQQRTRQQ